MIFYLATGVIRFLLRNANESSKSLIVDDRILQQIVLNSTAMHPGLQCKYQIEKNLILEKNYFSRISSCIIFITGSHEKSSSNRTTCS
jgi:hypothetical protein